MDSVNQEFPMKKCLYLLPLLAMLPLSAQDWEVGVFGGQQTYKNAGSAVDNVIVPGTPDNKTVYGVRAGYSVVDLGPVLFQVTAGFQPQSSTNVVSVLNNSGFESIASVKTYKTQSSSVGAMFNLQGFWSVGAGLEYRFEKYQYSEQSLSASRPWARVNMGIAIPAPVLKPFVGLEAAFPLTSTKLGEGGNLDAITKSMAPKGQVGVYAGIRF
jgi:hypothetical protein